MIRALEVFRLACNLLHQHAVRRPTKEVKLRAGLVIAALVAP